MKKLCGWTGCGRDAAGPTHATQAYIKLIVAFHLFAPLTMPSNGSQPISREDSVDEAVILQARRVRLTKAAFAPAPNGLSLVVEDQQHSLERCSTPVSTLKYDLLRILVLTPMVIVSGTKRNKPHDQGSHHTIDSLILLYVCARVIRVILNITYMTATNIPIVRAHTVLVDPAT